MQGEGSVQGYPEVNAECRALTVREPAQAHQIHEIGHPSAAFLTQLLAIKEGLPQTRERRREEPDIAAHVYEAHMAPLPPDHGKMLSRAA
jgi:hypothetical protein